MADELRPIGNDVEGFDSLKRAALALLSAYPGLGSREIVFEDLPENRSGLGIGADAGAQILSERRSITDYVRQSCQMPFFVIYRTAADRESEKLRVADFLDRLGRWLTRQNVEIDGTSHKLTAYPVLQGNRKITGMTVFNSYAAVPSESGFQDWYLPVAMNYTNEYEM